ESNFCRRPRLDVFDETFLRRAARKTRVLGVGIFESRVRTAGEDAGRRRRVGRIRLRGEEAMMWVAERVLSVSGDVGLHHRVAAEEIVQTVDRRGDVLLVFGEVVRQGEYDHIVDDEA